jgi:2'-hydroxyisoflavone reductase
MDRREFIGLSIGATAATALGGCIPPQHTGRKKSILVLGGTNFVGPAIVEHAVNRGHDVTLFNRGVTRPYLFPDVEKLRGNREVSGGDLTALAGRRQWDAVIDVWPEESALVSQTVDLLAERTDYYYFCSSISVYTDFSRAGLTEDSPMHEDDPGWYGGEKTAAERLIEARFADRYGVSRCHAILGPRDNGTAFHYWLRRLALQDEVLAPGTGDDPVQYTDVRDVAHWIIDCIESQRTGPYNLCGPSRPLTFREFLEGSRNAISSNARLVWADADFLRKEQRVRSFSDMPLWAPLDEDSGFYQIDGTRAVNNGATFRSLNDTARDSWNWFQSYFFKDATFPINGSGLSRERESEVLAAWHTAMQLQSAVSP